jgi:hypothetical protein
MCTTLFLYLSFLPLGDAGWRGRENIRELFSVGIPVRFWFDKTLNTPGKEPALGVLPFKLCRKV